MGASFVAGAWEAHSGGEKLAQIRAGLAAAHDAQQPLLRVAS
jgi:hypothetical protein